MSTSVASTEEPLPVWLRPGLRTFNATVMLMLLLAVMLGSWHFWVDFLHGIGPGPDLVPVTHLWPAGDTPFHHLMPAGGALPDGR